MAPTVFASQLLAEETKAAASLFPAAHASYPASRLITLIGAPAIPTRQLFS